MNRNEIIELLRHTNVHVYSETFAGVEKFYVEGQLEYFENFVKLLGQSCVSICHGIQQDSQEHEFSHLSATFCANEIKEYFEL